MIFCSGYHRCGSEQRAWPFLFGRSDVHPCITARDDRADGFHFHYVSNRTDLRYQYAWQNFFQVYQRFPDRSFFALLLACVCGIVFYNMGVFHIAVDGLESVSGSAGSNPLLVVLNVIPSNIASTFSSNTAVLAVVFLAVSLGLCMKTLGEEKTATLRKLIQELNDVVIVFLNFVVSKFGPVAIFMLLTRTFASYGVEHLKPAVAYVILTVALLLIFLIIGYPLSSRSSRILILSSSPRRSPASRSSASPPLRVRRRSRSTSRPRSRSSAWMRRSPPFVLPLGMTINMNGTAIMQVIATLFIAGCAGYSISFTQLVVIALLALIASAGTPAAPGSGAIILFTILSGLGYVNDAAMLAYQPHPRHQPPNRDARHRAQCCRRFRHEHLCRQVRGRAERGRLQRVRSFKKSGVTTFLRKFRFALCLAGSTHAPRRVFF